MDSDERQLVGRCLAGEPSAFEELYLAHAGRVKAYLLRCGFGFLDAEDLHQEVFLRAFKSLDTFDPSAGPLGRWLWAIARNVARRQAGRAARAGDFDPELIEEVLAAPADASADPQRREELSAIGACVAALPADLGRLVRLRYVDGLTTRAMAERAGMAEATVRLRLAESAELLRRCMTGKGFE